MAGVEHRFHVAFRTAAGADCGTRAVIAICIPRRRRARAASCLPWPVAAVSKRLEARECHTPGLVRIKGLGVQSPYGVAMERTQVTNSACWGQEYPASLGMHRAS